MTRRRSPARFGARGSAVVASLAATAIVPFEAQAIVPVPVSVWASGPLAAARAHHAPAPHTSAYHASAAALAQPPVATRVRLLVRDARSGEPVEGAIVTVAEGTALRTSADGIVELTLPTPAGEVGVRRLGYAPWRGTLRVRNGEAQLALDPVAAMLDAVAVRSRAFGAGSALQATAVVDAQGLAERMAPSIASVIEVEPGVTARTNGPMAAQPVIRGLGGDRVLVLEDGLRTGDIATTAPDHAVTIEPASARRIEVIRGPAGLLYGSNTLGGVVNVVRDDVPRERFRETRWSLASYGESVNRGLGGAARVHGGIGALAWQADGTSRTAGDTRTPGGIPLPFTDLDGFEAGAGAALVGRNGHAGVAVRDYRTFYGVPSSYAGITLPGAHDGGVYIDVRRSTARADAEWRPTHGVVEAVSAGANAVRFEQAEAEQGGFVGTEFGQLATSGELVARLRRGRHRGAVGVFSQWRDLRAAGSFTGTRPAVARTVAAFAVDEVAIGRLSLLAGVRADAMSTRPLDSTETLLLRDVRTRRFAAVTWATGAQLALGRGWSASAQVARAFRPPSIEELFSAGPHLASYAYEVGDPSLAAERGLGVDGVLRWQGTRGRAELAAYRMRISDFVAFAPQVDEATGLPMRDPRLRRYVVYRPRQVDAVLAGAEARVVLAPANGWTVDLAADLPRGRQVDGTPLPAMPAPRARADVRRLLGSWMVGVTVDRRFAQSRVPRPPTLEGATCAVTVRDGEATALPAEFCPTPAALLVGATVSVPVPPAWRFGWHTALTLSADNLLDVEWRDPLWRAKQVAPQPGRNVRVAVQVTP